MNDQNTSPAAPPATRTREPSTPDYLKDHVMVNLDVPFKIGGVLTTAVRLRRPNVKDRRAIAKLAVENRENAMELELALIARLSDNAPDDLNDMDDVDYRKACVEIQSFLPPHLRNLTL